MYWKREQTLGKGGFGFVSKAIMIHQKHEEEEEAINLPSVIAVKSAKLSESKSLLKEKQLLHQLKACPFIIRCFGDDTTNEDGQELYNILLEYASGGCLADSIQTCGKGLPDQVVRHHTKSILTALSHMHKLGYVHCDIKPQNVLLVKEGDRDDDDHSSKQNINGGSRAIETAKLADFGSAKKMHEDEDGGFRGTVLYSAPESIKHQQYVPESDVWALGCTVLNMLTSKSPWKIAENAKATDVLFMIGCSNEIPEIPSTKKVSKEAKDFLKKCLVKDPRARWNVEMLLDHPFVKVPATPAGKCCGHRSRISRGLNSLMHRCFHIRSSAAIHASG